MHAWLLVALIVAAGCGRISFDARDDAGTDSGGGIPISLVLPDGGQIAKLAVTADGTLYALSLTTGAFRSDDDGLSWTPCGPRVGSSIAANNGSVWMSGDTIGLSVDRCATWNNVPPGRFSDNVVLEAGQPWGLLDNGIVRFTGNAWMPALSDGNRYVTLTGSGGTLVAGSRDSPTMPAAGLVRSTDGMTWTPIMAGLPGLSITDVDSGTTRMYAITTAATAVGMACSADTGATWAPCGGLGGYNVAVDPLNQDHVVAAVYDDLIESMNAMTAGSVMLGLRDVSGLDDATILDLVYAPSGALYATSDRGVFRSAPGPLLFEPRMGGLSAWDIDIMIRDGDNIYLATRGGSLRSIAGAPFEISTSGIVGNTHIRDLAIAPDSARTLFAAGRAIWASEDQGKTWTSRRDLDMTDGYAAPAIIFAGSRAYAGTGTRVLTADASPWMTWTPHQVAGANRQITALRHAFGTLWTGASNGLFVSTDDAATFQPVSALGTIFVKAIVALADDRIAVASSTGLWLSDTTRTTWTRTLDTRFVTSVTEVGNALVATSDTGVVISRDGGITWMPVPGVETAGSSASLFDPATNQIVVGTNAGLVRVSLP